MQPEPVPLSDWPQRWHQIVAEYNTAFGEHQARMRSHFEDKFDHIRRENDLDLNHVRLRRDKCAQRMCDLMDDKSSTDIRIIDACSTLRDLGILKMNLDVGLNLLKSEFEHLTKQYEQLVDSQRSRKTEQNERQLRVSAYKSELREEVRDLLGFIRMRTELSKIAGCEGVSIMATHRARSRR